MESNQHVMNRSCFTPSFSLSESSARFSLRPRDAIAWMVSRRDQSNSAAMKLLADCPEALFYALLSNSSDRARQTEDEVSPESLVTQFRSPVRLPESQSVIDLLIAPKARKKYRSRLKSLESEAIDRKAANRLNGELFGLIEHQLFDLKVASLPKPDLDAWRAIIEAGKSETSLSLDLADWLAEESETEDSEFERRLHLEKMASMKQLAYGASHEINNPLANIASRAQTLMMDETDPDRKLRLAKINQQAFRAHEMIADMMLFAHPPVPEYSEFDMLEVLEQVVSELQIAADEQSTAVRIESFAGETKVQADSTQMAVAVRALLTNSLEALGEGGRITVSLRAIDSTLEIEVTDDGPGLSDSAQRHLFDPFFSGREAGRGLGFGLSKVWRIAEIHSGEILAESPSDGGARFRLRIPYRSSMKSSA